MNYKAVMHILHITWDMSNTLQTPGKAALAVVVLLLTVAASPVWSEPPSGMVHPHGSVSVNGAQLSAPSAVFNGDKLHTDYGATANVTADGSTIAIFGQTDAVYSANEFDMSCGAAVLTTTRGLAAKVDNYTATPNQGAISKFDVMHRNGILRFSALQGDLRISNGTQTWILPQGQVLTQSTPNECFFATQNVPPGTEIPVAAPAALWPYAVGAGVATVVVVCTTGFCNPASPSGP